MQTIAKRIGTENRTDIIEPRAIGRLLRASGEYAAVNGAAQDDPGVADYIDKPRSTAIPSSPTDAAGEKPLAVVGTG